MTEHADLRALIVTLLEARDAAEERAEAAESALAKVTAERDAARSDLDDLLPSLDAGALMLTQVGRERDRAEAALARAMEAMPTEEEYRRVVDAFEGECMEAPKARREWLAAGAAWLARLDAATNTGTEGGRKC